jgi:hypothetical protein
MNIRTIVNEAKRGCGYRKQGGLYLVSGGLCAPCKGLPIPIETCPVCNSGIHPSRGWTWIAAKALFQAAGITNDCGLPHCSTCPVSHAPKRAGLLWVGETYYPSPEDFTQEADQQGVSRRISAIPRDFVVGETWVYFAHRKSSSSIAACPECNGERFIDDEAGNHLCGMCDGAGKVEVWTPGIFHAFKPERIEYIVRDDDTPEKLESLEKRGISLVRLVRTDGVNALFDQGDETNGL